MKLVRFECGRYGVMRKRWWGRVEFLSLGILCWWVKPEDVEAYCKGTREDAEQARNAVQMQYEVVE